MPWWKFKREAKQERTVEIKASSLSEFGKFLAFGASQNADTARAAMSLFDESSAVALPITRIADAVAALEPVLYQDKKKITDHPLLTYLKNPCAWSSYRLIMKSSTIYYLTTGETFFLTIGNMKRPPIELYSINPALISHGITSGLIYDFKIDGDFYPSTFKYDDKIKTYISPEMYKQLTHIRDFSSQNNSVMRGKSRLGPVSNAARQQILGMRHNVSMLENGGRLSLIFHFENDMGDEEFQVAKQRVREQFGGATKAGEIGVTAGGKLKIENAGLTPMDMDWSNAQKNALSTILMAYNLPLPLFSLDASTFNNMSSAVEMFYDDAVLPNAKIIFDALASLLFPRFGIADGMKLSYDPDNITALISRRNREVKLRKEIGVESDNELRGMLGRESYPGGDTMYKPASDIPIGTDILTEDDDITDVSDSEDSAKSQATA